MYLFTEVDMVKLNDDPEEINCLCYSETN